MAKKSLNQIVVFAAAIAAVITSGITLPFAALAYGAPSFLSYNTGSGNAAQQQTAQERHDLLHSADESGASSMTVSLRDVAADVIANDVGNATLPSASTTIGGYTVSLSWGRMVALPEGWLRDVYVYCTRPNMIPLTGSHAADWDVRIQQSNPVLGAMNHTAGANHSINGWHYKVSVDNDYGLSAPFYAGVLCISPPK